MSQTETVDSDLDVAWYFFDDLGRQIRSLVVSKLDRSSLSRVQNREKEIKRFLEPFEIKTWAKFDYSGPLNKAQLESLKELCRETKPNSEEPKYPPRAIAAYHHAWDWNVIDKNYVLPSRKEEKKRAKNELEG